VKTAALYVAGSVLALAAAALVPAAYADLERSGVVLNGVALNGGGRDGVATTTPAASRVIRVRLADGTEVRVEAR
jgi:hypothetical protein